MSRTERRDYPYDPRMAPDRSALARAVETVGDRWSLLVIEALLDTPLRFNDLLESVQGIASNVLSQRLKHLEAQGLVIARPYSRRPPRMSYELSAAGAELAGALRMLAQWGSGRSDDMEALRHSTCGTPMEARWYCPTCSTAVDEKEAAQIKFL